MHLLFTTCLRWLLPLTLSICLAGTTQAETPRVVATIKPIHSLVAGVMQGVGKPELLIAGLQSPHNFSLRPSDMRRLNSADIVFWVGESLETSLKGPLDLIAKKNPVISLMESADIQHLSNRKGGIRNDNHDHGTDDHHHLNDPHIWLSTINGRKITLLIEQQLSRLDPENQLQYHRNSQAMLARLDQLDLSVAKKIKPVQQRPYLVFHDAYQAFEQQFKLNSAGSVTLNPEQQPGARRVAEIRQHITNAKAVCLFSEPQFQSRLAATLIEGTSTRTGILDSLGSDLTPGPDQYFQLIDNLAQSLVDCLGGINE
ncbi:MAG: zinc ABC transporter solute-binding protein [Gammaproteobacteria bacterium]|nr:zinc ABC transporter solute-binding protein [Gammaproteobacteria bacterium]